MIETMFLVPERDNAGAPLPLGFWRTLRGELAARFGGFSERRGVEGRWVYEGRTYHDRSRELTVAFSTWGQLPAWLAIVEWARVEARQEALYIRVAGTPEIWTGWPP